MTDLPPAAVDQPRIEAAVREILIAIGDRVIRLSSKDLSPIGPMGSVRIIDVKE